MSGFLKSLFASAAAASGRADLEFQIGKDTSYARALVNERSRVLDLAPSRETIYGEARRRLGGGEAITFGTLPSGQAVSVRRDLALMSALILGATAAGKSRLLVALLLDLLRRAVRGGPG